MAPVDWVEHGSGSFWEVFLDEEPGFKEAFDSIESPLLVEDTEVLAEDRLELELEWALVKEVLEPLEEVEAEAFGV